MVASRREAASKPDVLKDKMNIVPTPEKECREAPPMSPAIDVNICSGKVKKMVEKYSQNSLISTPSRSLVRTSLNFEKSTNSPQASPTIISFVNLGVPKLCHNTGPSKPKFRDVKSETSKVWPESSDSKSSSAEPAFQRLHKRTLSASSYNVDSFLKDALGSQLFSQSISSIHSEHSFTEDSDMSFSSSDSVPVVKTSSMIQDTDMNGFVFLRMDNTEKYRRPVVEPSMPFQTLGKTPPIHNTERVRRLLIEVSVQRSLVAQASKALYLCHASKQFKESQELVEGERILLLASLRSQAAQEEMNKPNSPPSTNSALSGYLAISDISVPLKRDVFLQLDRNLFPQWFLCVLILGETVQATEAIQVDHSQPILKFRASMHLSNLSCDFRARLQLYALRVPHKSPKRKSTLVQACKKLQRPLRHYLGSTEKLIYLRNPAFSLIGSTELTVGLIGKQQPVSCSLEQVPMVSLIKRTINFRLSAQMINNRQLSGFLNILRPTGEGHIAVWQRWWCRLDGNALRCWNYPSQQEEREAVFSIDLLKCRSEKVVPVPRVLCSRPRTFMLELLRSHDPHDLYSTLLACSPHFTTLRHFLSCESAADMKEWSTAIDECLEALHLWHIVPKTKRE